MQIHPSRPARWRLLVAALLVLGGCTVETTPGAPRATPSPVSAERARRGPSPLAAPTRPPMPPPPSAATPTLPGESARFTVTVRQDPTLGRILVDGSGRTLYRYTRDGPNASACAGRCARVWPPLVATATPTLDDEASGHLGLITRGDGSKQVTYNEIPLYYFVGDEKAGDAAGEGDGGTWFVVRPGARARDDLAPSQ
jgi:predicted lipoprotein with Yx(FWY)xxD motif